MTKARLSAAFQQSCPTRHTCSAKYQEVQTLANFNTWIMFHFYSLTRILTIDTKLTNFIEQIV